jgi:hypothetical protein
MKKIILLPIAILLLSLTGCKSSFSGVSSTPISVGSNIRPLDADVSVDVSKKISGEASVVYFLVFRLSGDSKFAEGVDYSVNSSLFSSKIARAKSAAAYKAVTDSTCDIIVHPNYIVDVENWVFFKKIKVKVTGYAGTINKIYQQNNCNPCSSDYKGAVKIVN